MHSTLVRHPHRVNHLRAFHAKVGNQCPHLCCGNLTVGKVGFGQPFWWSR